MSHDVGSNELVERILPAYGRVHAVDLASSDVTAFVQALSLGVWRFVEEESPDVQVRLVLGRACRTAVQAVSQFRAALQLPYEADRGWYDFSSALGDRPGSLREIVVVADAVDLLLHEEHELWWGLARDLCATPSCLAIGWSTLVLCDSDYRWESSRFGSATNAEALANAR